MLGQALVRVLNSLGWETMSLGRQDGDIENVDFLDENLKKANADVVFNAIAWTRVDDAEDCEEEAFAVNRALPANLARCISRLPKGHLVHYSTDFVFSGQRSRPWSEEDIPRPESVYGASKLEGERAVLETLPDRSCVLRTAWLFGPGRKNFITAILGACQKRDMVSVVDDQTGSPTYTMDLAKWSARLAEGKTPGLWHAVNSGQATWCELAAEAIALASGPCRIEPISSGQWPQKARRPAYSVLDNGKLAKYLGEKPRPWPQTLRDYIFGDFLDKEKKS